MATKRKPPADKWIAGATAGSHGQFSAKAKHAGQSTHAYAEAHKDSPGRLGKQARLALALEKARKHR